MLVICVYANLLNLAHVSETLWMHMQMLNVSKYERVRMHEWEQSIWWEISLVRDLLQFREHIRCVDVYPVYTYASYEFEPILDVVSRGFIA